MVVSYVAFGTIGLTARTPPFLLARSIINGPGRLYLEENCHKPGKDYFVCGHLGDMPPSVAEFLWDPRGIYMSATPDQRARIRAEQTEIVLNAAAAHPWTQLRSSFENVWRNLITFHVRDFRIELGLQDDELGYRASVKSPSVAIVAARETSSQFIYASTVISLVFLVGLVIRFGFSALPPVTWFVFFALISNATITGALSSEAPRYQARVIWLVPLVTIVCAAAAFRTWSKKDSQSEKRPAI